MKKNIKGKIAGFLVFVAIICVVAFIADTISGNNESVGDTGWTVDQFIDWAYKVQPVKEHKRWKIWEDGKRELMKEKPDKEPFHYGVRIDANDVVPSYPVYSYEWVFELPKDLPIPIIKVLDRIDFNDVGKYIGEILPYAVRPVAICALKKGKPISSEAVEVKLLSSSDDKLNFSVETEPFIFSMIPEVRGKIGNKMVLYVPLDCKENVNICKAKGRGITDEKGND